ncbi:MAG: outer membrane beta-barrel protein [Casimicrobiaceae bacterium]
MIIQKVASFSSILLAILIAAPANAAEGSLAGFYGGLNLRTPGGKTSGATLGIPSSALNRFSIPVMDDSSSATTVYGGYRFANDIAVEASLNATDPYTLRPDAMAMRRGVGLFPSAASLGAAEGQAKSWNLDLYTGWNFYRNLALYGRLGYAQTELAPSFANALLASGDPRRLRDGMNYGVGVRYNMSPALGLRLEYGRFGRFAGEIGSSPLESDQVTVDLQFRF